MRFLIYCDESSDAGRFYSNFYGGALIRASDRERINARLEKVKSDHKIQGEMKWTKVCDYNEDAYLSLVDEIFLLLSERLMKIRIMFRQQVNQTKGYVDYAGKNDFTVLYYHFLKHAFGLTYCNPDRIGPVHVNVYLDDMPTKAGDFHRLKAYLSSLTNFPFFSKSAVTVRYEDITDVDSSDHIILQAVDVVLGAMQFRLNEFHKAMPKGKKRRAKRTRAKERVYIRINRRIREIYPNFNIGTSTGQANGPTDKWLHPYRHWCFIPNDSVYDRSKGKKHQK